MNISKTTTDRNVRIFALKRTQSPLRDKAHIGKWNRTTVIAIYSNKSGASTTRHYELQVGGALAVEAWQHPTSEEAVRR